MGEVIAKVWREMTTEEILGSIDVALNVLEDRLANWRWRTEERKIQEKYLKLLLVIGLRCIQVVNEQW